MRKVVCIPLLTLTALAGDAPPAVHVELLGGSASGFTVVVAQADQLWIPVLRITDAPANEVIRIVLYIGSDLRDAGSFTTDDGGSGGVQNVSVAANWGRWDGDGDGEVEIVAALEREGQRTPIAEGYFLIGAP